MTATLSALHELALGTPASREYLDLLEPVYRDAVAVAEVGDEEAIHARFAEVLAHLAARRPVREPVSDEFRRVLAEFLPALPHFLPVAYKDFGEWLRLSLPNGWYLHVSREDDTLRIDQQAG